MDTICIHFAHCSIFGRFGLSYLKKNLLYLNELFVFYIIAIQKIYQYHLIFVDLVGLLGRQNCMCWGSFG